MKKDNFDQEVEETEKNKIVRLSIQISYQQSVLLTNYLKEQFEETGIMHTSSSIVRKALSLFILIYINICLIFGRSCPPLDITSPQIERPSARRLRPPIGRSLSTALQPIVATLQLIEAALQINAFSIL